MWKEKPEAYNGDMPYIFVSYCHEDSKEVLPVINILQESGYRIWYDEGIEIGTEWTDCVADHLHNSTTFVFFVTSASVKSKNCLDELAYAKKDGKAIVLIHLESGVEMPRGMEMQTSRYQHLFYYKIRSEEMFIKRMSQAPCFGECREKETPSERTDVSVKDKGARKTKKKSKTVIFILSAVIVLTVFSVLMWQTGESGGFTDNYGKTSSAVNESTSDAIGTGELNIYTLSTGKVTVEGKDYNLPVSVSRLSNDGWSIKNEAVSLQAGELKYFYFEKGGKVIQCEISNPDTEASPLADCRVVSVTFYSHDKTQAKIADCLYVGQSAQEVRELLKAGLNGEGETEKSGENESVFKYIGRSFVLRVYFDDAKGMVKSVYYKNTESKFEGIG